MRHRRITLVILVISLITLHFIPVRAELTSSETQIKLIKTITGDISPKSVRASQTGYVSAHNMMYQHSVTIYDADSTDLIKRISDRVDLSKFGISGYTGTHQGAPVEGAYSPDGAYLYVTNYAMYGKGFNREGTDICKPADKYDRSFLYRINTANWNIDAVYKVGTVPKVVAVTPDNKYVLVSHWCSYDLYVISVESQKVIKILPIGAYPRGITISKDSKYAYVAQMGGTVIHRIELGSWQRSQFTIGSNPRALVLSPDDSILYATLNKSGRVVAYDLNRGKVIRSVKTGNAARSLDISSDGTSLFVVNFSSGTLSKVRASDFSIIQNIKVCKEPIGVTYESIHKRVWVACYEGLIKVFADFPSQ